MSPGTPRSIAVRACGRTKMPSRRMPRRLARFCVVDLELSGLDPRADEMVSFGAVPIAGASSAWAGASRVRGLSALEGELSKQENDSSSRPGHDRDGERPLQEHTSPLGVPMSFLVGSGETVRGRLFQHWRGARPPGL